MFRCFDLYIYLTARCILVNDCIIKTLDRKYSIIWSFENTKT